MASPLLPRQSRDCMPGKRPSSTEAALLHALHVKPFDGPTLTYPKSSLEAALDTNSRNHLARLARCDPSRLRCSEKKGGPWMLVNDAWVVFCPRCIFTISIAARFRMNGVCGGWRHVPCALLIGAVYGYLEPYRPRRKNANGSSSR
jgi:hypothetical protein